MADKALAVKYRPDSFDDVVEQSAVKSILQNQLQTSTFKNAYLFCGGAGTGKTTCARIFAKEINGGKGTPIEMDAASNSGVDDVRNILQQAQTKSLNSEYKVFIIDECHSISNTGWQAFLKLIEEPPAKSIFIFCTTDPQKIPKTILSRVQRYDFQRISQDGIVDRLKLILDLENAESFDYTYDWGPLEYIAKIADGGMRDAISLMDKCLAYSNELTLENVVKALGAAEYDDMMQLTTAVFGGDEGETIRVVEKLHANGKDLKQFIRSYINFLLDVSKYIIGVDSKYIGLPLTDIMVKFLNDKDFMGDVDYDTQLLPLLDAVVKLNAEVKYSQYVKADLEAALLLFEQQVIR